MWETTHPTAKRLKAAPLVRVFDADVDSLTNSTHCVKMVLFITMKGVCGIKEAVQRLDNQLYLFENIENAHGEE